MILEVVQSKWSLTWYDPLGPRMCVLELMNGHVLQTLREQLKVPGSRLEGSELLTSSLPSNLEPGTFNCSRKVCNTCPFINSKTHIRGPNGSYQVNDHFDCTTSNIIYCITCTLCNKLYIGESGRKLGDRFREHLLDVKNKGSDLSKPVARHFNLPGHSHEHMEICRIYLHLGNNETRKRKEQRLIFKLGTLAPNGINERFSFA